MSDAEVGIQRERTAIFRDRLSTPMQMLLKHEFLDGEYSVFDYGCGRGDDLRALESQGIAACGWDPHYAPTNPRVSAGIVNLGFVINVIEKTAERAEALRSAFELARKLLVVTVMLDSQAQYRNVRRLGDGVVTSTKTFQKYYSQAEIRQYLEQQLARQPIVVAPGCLFVFRSDEDEQDFLARRHAHRIAADELVKWSLPPDRNLRLYERNKDLLESLWSCCLRLGRIPAADEFDGIDELKEKIGSPKKALTILSGDERSVALKNAAQQRTGDLCVFFALNLFERRKSAASLSPTLQRDIRAFFGTYKNALELARPTLFAAGRPHEILAARQLGRVSEAAIRVFRLKIGARTDGPLGSQGPPHLPRARNTRGFAQLLLRAHEGLDDKPFPDQPRRRYLVRRCRIGIPSLAHPGTYGHRRHEARIAHANGDGWQQAVCEPLVFGLQTQRIDAAFSLLRGIEFRTEWRSQHVYPLADQVLESVLSDIGFLSSSYSVLALSRRAPAVPIPQRRSR